MSNRESSKALGKGLKALIRERSSSGKGDEDISEAEARAQNMEFYGSLMKQYVQVGEGDNNTEELLLRIRQHLGIGEEEHLHLVQTLRKRDTIDPKVTQEELHKAQTEMKQELKQLFMEFRGDEPAPNDIELNGGMAEGQGRREETAIPLPERTSEMVKGPEMPITAPPVEGRTEDHGALMKKRVRRTVIPKDLDERAGIIQESGGHIRARVDWLDEGKVATIPMPPSSASPVPGPDPGTSGMQDATEQDQGRSGDMFEDLGEVPDSGPPVQAINVVKSSDFLRDMLDEEGIEAVKPLVKGGLRDEVDKAYAGPAAPDDHVEKQKPNVLEDSPISLKLLMEEGRFTEALEMCDRLLRDEPGNTSMLNERGFILYNLGREDEALEAYKGLLSLDPEAVETMVNYAQILAAKGKLDESLGYLDLAVKKDPYSEDAWNNKAVVLSRFGRLREALVCLDEAMRINDRSVVSLTNTGIILERMGELGPAMEAYRTILDIEPDNEIARQGHESCLRQLGLH